MRVKSRFNCACSTWALAETTAALASRSDGAILDEGRVTFHVELGLAVSGLRLGEHTFGLVERGLKGARVDFKQEVAFPDGIAFPIILREQVTGDLRANLGVDPAVEHANPLMVDRHVGLGDGRDFDEGRRRSGGGLLLATREANQSHGRDQKKRFCSFRALHCNPSEILHSALRQRKRLLHRRSFPGIPARTLCRMPANPTDGGSRLQKRIIAFKAKWDGRSMA
jgi:hypothetical protein